MPKLSIVIPIYNSENYLAKCLDSVISQSFTNFELILVDDGSTDGCSLICDRLSKNDKRIKVIRQKNAGVSAARNAGMREAKGDYLTVVDSDDWLEKDMYQSMFRYIDAYNADVVMCDCVKEYPNKLELYTHNIRQGFYNYAQLQEEYYPHMLMMENVEYPATISNCLMVWRRSITANKGIEYLIGVKSSEDLLFGAQIMSCAKSFYYMKGNAPYHYCLHKSSASKRFSKERWEDYKRLHDEAVRYFATIQEYRFEDQINKMVLFFLLNYFEMIRNSDLELNDKKHITNELLREEVVCKMFSTINIQHLLVGRKQRLKTLMLKYRIGINCLLRK